MAEVRESSGEGEVMIRVDDVDTVLAAVRAAGANVAADSHDWEYGERQGGLVDPFGQTWVLTQTLLDTDPADWGADRDSAHSVR